MKNKIVKLIFPLLAFVLSITAAFAFPSVDHGADAVYIGYKRVGLNCVATDVICSDANNGIICKDASNNTLYRLNGTGQCTEQLWKPVE